MRGHVRPAKNKQGKIIKGAYDTVIELEPDPVTGKRRQKWKRVYGTREEADAYVRDQIRALHEGAYIADDRKTFATFAREWVETHAAHKRLKTYQSYRMVVEEHLIPFFGDYRLRAVTGEVIQRYHRHALERGKLDRQKRPTGEGLSPSTVNYHHRVIHMILKAAYRRRLVSRNAAEDVDPPSRRKYTPEFLTAPQARKLLKVAKHSGSRYYTLYLAALTTGMRAGELLGWRWVDVDLERGVGRILQTLEAPGREPVFEDLTKSNRGRAILLVRPLVEALRAWRAEQDEERRLLGPRYRDYGLVFTVPNGAPIDDGNLAQRDFKPLLRAAGLPEIRFHDLRHATASILLEMGVNPKIVAEILGHSTTKLTLDTYSHATIGLQSLAAAKMEEALFGAD